MTYTNKMTISFPIVPEANLMKTEPMTLATGHDGPYEKVLSRKVASIRSIFSPSPRYAGERGLGGEGRKTFNNQEIEAVSRLSAPHPQPFSPEYRGEGSKNLFVARTTIPNSLKLLEENILISPGFDSITVCPIAPAASADDSGKSMFFSGSKLIKQRYTPMLVMARVALFVFLSVILGTAANSQDADKLYPKSGSTQTGKIVGMTRDNVVMEIRGSNQNFPSPDILRIVYEGEPAMLSRAKEQAATNQWDQALESLKRVDPKSVERNEVKSELLYYQGLVLGKLALQGQGDAAASKNRLLEYARANSSSYHFYELSEMLGMLAVSIGASDEAAKYFGAMGLSPVPEIMLQGRYLMGSALLAQGKTEEAKKAFSEAIAASADSVAAKKFQKLSKVAINRCDIVEGKIPEAIDSLRKMVDEGDSTDSQLFAAIYNSLGLAHQKAGKNEEAILDFLHTDLLFQSESDMHAEALYYLSQLFAAIGEPQRAADAKSRLQSLYSNSTWAKK